MKSTLTTLAAVCVLSSSIAVAGETVAKDATPAEMPAVKSETMTEEQSKTPTIFEKLDQNKDGKVSPQEAQVSPALVKGFEKIDANKDGFLTPDEFSQLQVRTAPQRSYIALAALQAL